MTADRAAFEPIARDAARRAGIDQEMFVRQIQQESGFNPEAYNAASGATGIAQIIPRFHPDVNPRDPVASLTYAAQWMARLRHQFGSYRKALAAYNWGPGNVTGWDGRRETLPSETRRYLDVILGSAWLEPSSAPAPAPAANQLRVTDDGVRLRDGPSTSAAILAEIAADTLVTPVTAHAWRQIRLQDGRTGWMAATYLEPALSVPPDLPTPGRLTFDPSTPTEYQLQDWTCSIRSVMWMLKSLGIAVTADEAQDAMSPRYVTRELGLLDGSGRGIVSVLREHWGITAKHMASASFDDALRLAGEVPLSIGLYNWGGVGLGHWSAVRGRSDGTLSLANPARGAAYGQVTMSRDGFALRGPASLVWIPL